MTQAGLRESETPSRLPALRLFLEAAAIFAGVTLGFLADDYRDYRNDREQERESLAQVLQDLELDLDDIAPIVRQSTSIAQAMRWIANHVARGELPADSLLTIVDSLSQTPAYSYEESDFAYSGLKSTGRIDLVRDVDLRRALVHYFEDRQPIVATVNAQWKRAYDEWWKTVGSYIDFFPDAPVEEGWPHVREVDGRALGRDREFVLLTITVMDLSSALRTDIEEAIALNADLAARIEAYLDES